MELQAYVTALQEDLAAVAAVGDEQTTRAAQLLALALESAFARRLLDALNEAVLELADGLEHTRVEVRLAGDEVRLVPVAEELAQDAGDTAANARITLRLSESLKGRVEAAAARDSVSVNTWLVRQLARAAESGRRTSGTGRRLTGYGHS